MSRHLMIVAGEASGDLYGSLLAREIRSLAPEVKISGVGGQGMASAGVDVFLDSSNISVVGFWEAAVRLGRLRQALDRVKKRIRDTRPDLLVLVDYPGMNLRLARFARGQGIRVMYYVSPQVWAWGRSRIEIIRNNVGRMVVILPFELELYRKEGVSVDYVGHPLMDVVKTDLTREAFAATIGADARARFISLLPGSRPQEIRHHVAPLLQTALIIRREMPGLEFVLVSLPAHADVVRGEMRRLGFSMPIAIDRRYEAIRYSDLAVTCSGTVTLETALLGTPMIVIYKLALFSWMLGRMIVKVPYISLVNLVAGERIVPEFIQADVKPQSLAREAMAILRDERRRQRMIEGLAGVRRMLGAGGATRRAAEIAISLAGGAESLGHVGSGGRAANSRGG